MSETKVHHGGYIPTWVPKVVTLTFVDDDVHRVAFLDQEVDSIGELQLPSRTGGDALQCIKNGTVEQVAAGCYKVLGGILHGWFFHHAKNLLYSVLTVVILGLFDGEDTIVIGFLGRNLEGTQN